MAIVIRCIRVNCLTIINENHIAIQPQSYTVIEQFNNLTV
jgi:hypothetical protein